MQVLTEPLETLDGRESFYRGTIHNEKGINKMSLTDHQGSGNLFFIDPGDCFFDCTSRYTNDPG
jgi:molybdopterin biosynthesis enzyme